MSDKPVAGPSGIKRPRKVAAKNPNRLTDEELATYLEYSDDSLEEPYLSSDDESYHLDVQCDDSDGLSVEEAVEEGPLEPAHDDVHNIVWSDPPLINRKHLAFTEETGLLQQPAGDRPIDYFNLLVSDEFYNLILEQTNNYAEEVFLASGLEAARITQWKPLVKEELRLFLGLFLHTGTIMINRLQDYWKTHRLFNLTCFSDYMGRNRFLLILRCLHFSKNEPRLGVAAQRDRLHKIRPLLDYFNNRMLEVYSPQRVLSLDESMVSWRGRLVFRQFLPGKRHKYGIKTYVLAEPDGLTLKQLVYSGSKDLTGPQGHASTVVMQLMEEQLDKGHSLYMDNFYNSHTLAKTLLQRKTYCTGTLRSNRKNNCVEVVKAKLRKGGVIEKCDENNSLIMAKWRDKREVTFISTEHNATLNETTTKRGQKKMKPEAIIAYNQNMSGVDRKDQMLSYNACDRKTIRWYKKLGLNILQILLLNSWHFYQRYSGKKPSFYDFRFAIIEDLVAVKATPRAPSKLPAMIHLPSHLPRSQGGKVQRKDCRVCRKRKIRTATTFCCTLCSETPGLCLEPCFRIFHNY